MCSRTVARWPGACSPGNFLTKINGTIPCNLGVTKSYYQPNKSAAGMQHTPPRDIFNVKKIILKLDLFMQSLKKIGKEMPKVESEKNNL